MASLRTRSLDQKLTLKRVALGLVVFQVASAVFLLLTGNAFVQRRNRVGYFLGGVTRCDVLGAVPVEGNDVRATLDEVPVLVGTSGRSSMKSVVLRMDVDTVTEVSGSCVR